MYDWTETIQVVESPVGFRLFGDKKFGNFDSTGKVEEKDSEFLVELPSPGFEREDFLVSISKDILTIKIKDEIKSKYPKVSRSWKLENSVDISKVTSEYKNGILYIHLPKKEEVKPKEIEVK